LNKENNPSDTKYRLTPRGAEWLTPWATQRDFSSQLFCQKRFGSKTPSAHAIVGRQYMKLFFQAEEMYNTTAELKGEVGE